MKISKIFKYRRFKRAQNLQQISEPRIRNKANNE